jgi:hypothetical protein
MCQMRLLLLQMFFYGEINVFLQLSRTTLYVTKGPMSTLKIVLQEVVFSKTNWPFKGNNVLHTLASNTKGFLSRDTCVSSTQLIRPIWNKDSLSSPETPKSQDVYCQKLSQFSLKTMCQMHLLLHRCLSLERFMCFFNWPE